LASTLLTCTTSALFQYVHIIDNDVFIFVNVIDSSVFRYDHVIVSNVFQPPRRVTSLASSVS